MEKEKEKNGPLYCTLFFSAKEEDNFLLLLFLGRGVCRRPLVMRMPKKGGKTLLLTSSCRCVAWWGMGLSDQRGSFRLSFDLTDMGGRFRESLRERGFPTADTFGWWITAKSQWKVVSDHIGRQIPQYFLPN